VSACPSGIEARRRELLARRKVEVRGRKPLGAPASLPLDDDAFHLEGQLHASPARTRASFGAFAVASAGSLRRASAGGSNSAASTFDASATKNGPISVRRSVRQCPPSASAIART